MNFLGSDGHFVNTINPLELECTCNYFLIWIVAFLQDQVSHDVIGIEWKFGAILQQFLEINHIFDILHTSHYILNIFVHVVSLIFLSL